MTSPDVSRILGQLSSPDAGDAWRDFLDAYAALILHVIRTGERDPDDISDCFLFVCEQLSQSGFRRLRRFRVDGPASFPTWLCVVVRNLCIDWHRKRSGRRRPFRSVAGLPVLEQELFRCVYEQGMGAETALFHLRPRFPALSWEQISSGIERVRQTLAPRQLWLLSTRQSPSMPIGDPHKPVSEPIDPGPDPEMLAASSESRATLSRALSRLPWFDRLLVRLRFEQDLTLSEIARLTKLESAQSVDRRIRMVLHVLRQRMDGGVDARGKSADERCSPPESVKNDTDVRVSIADGILSELHRETPDE